MSDDDTGWLLRFKLCRNDAVNPESFLRETIQAFAEFDGPRPLDDIVNVLERCGLTY